MRAAFACPFLFLFLAVPCAHADLLTSGTERADAWAIGAKVSTLGVGFEVSRMFGDAFALRGVFNGYRTGLRENVNDVDYKGKLDLKSAGLIADWHPLGTGFRVSAGLLVNRSELRIDARPNSRTFELAGKTYDASDVGAAEGDAHVNSVSPYLGVGFGGALGGDAKFGVSLDLGVMFQGEPKFDMNVTCGASVPVRQCARLTNDIEEERQQFEHDTKKLSYYPLLSVGITMRLGDD